MADTGCGGLDVELCYWIDQIISSPRLSANSQRAQKRRYMPHRGLQIHAAFPHGFGHLPQSDGILVLALR